MSVPERDAAESNGPPAIGAAAPPVPECAIPPGRAVLILLAFYAVQAAAALAVGVAAGLYYRVARGPLQGAVLAEFQRVAVMPAAALAMAGGGLVVFAMTRRALLGPIRGGALRPVGWRAAPGKEIALAACLGPALVAFYVFVLARVFPPDPAQTWGPIAQALSAGGWPRVLWAVLLLGVAPPVEEFLFRGVLWSGLARRMTPALAAAAVTVLFVVGHVSEIRGYWPAWLMLSALGVSAVALRVRGGSLVPPVVLHAAYNAGMVTLAYLGAS